MLHGLSIPSSIIMPLRSSSKRVQKSSHPYQQYPIPPPISISFSASSCKHPPSATLDLLILILVLFSLSFLLFSSLSHVLRSLSPFLLHFLSLIRIPYYLLTPLLLLSFPLSLTLCLLCRHFPRRRCRNPKCKGLKKALEFDVQLQTDDHVADPVVSAMWREIDALPWKGGQGGNNPDYECLRAELRKMAPLNGRAVLLFRSRCGCPLAKLEAWGPKRGGGSSGRRPKKLWELDQSINLSVLAPEHLEVATATAPSICKGRPYMLSNSTTTAKPLVASKLGGTQYLALEGGVR